MSSDNSGVESSKTIVLQKVFDHLTKMCSNGEEIVAVGRRLIERTLFRRAFASRF